MEQKIEVLERDFRRVTDNQDEGLRVEAERKKALENEPTITQTVTTKNGRKFKISQRV